jgi:hypothetical protein
MGLQGLIGLFIKFSFITRIIKAVAGVLLGLALLGWVVERSGPHTVEAVVHVSEADVDVVIDERVYPIQDLSQAPIVCELSVGWHRLAMKRGDRILFEESFEAEPGKNVVRSAYNLDPKDRVRLRRRDRRLRRLRTQNVGRAVPRAGAMGPPSR